MKYLLEQSRMKHLVRNRNGYLMLACLSMILNLVLATFLFFMTSRERVVLVPPEIQKSFWLTSDRVSPEYLSEMAIFLASLNFNMTPANAAMQHRILLQYVDPAYYATLKMRFAEMEERIRTGHVITSFHPDAIQVDARNLVAEISGELHHAIGDMRLEPQHRKFRIRFGYRNGQLRITSFPEIQNHA